MAKWKTIIIITVALIFQGAPVQAELTGETIYEGCKEVRGQYGVGLCDGYIAGMGGQLREDYRNSGHLCVPDGALDTVGQGVYLFLNFVDRNPDYRSRSAVDAVRDSMLNAFPCR